MRGLLRRRLQDRPLRHQGAAVALAEEAAALLRHVVRESPRHRRRQRPAGYPRRHPGRHQRCAALADQQHVDRSGPQVVVNDDRIAENENADDLYPWKRWHVVTDPLGNNGQQPVTSSSRTPTRRSCSVSTRSSRRSPTSFLRFLATSLALSVLGGAGRTASGLAMLMGNAAKILQTVAANIDNDIIEPAVGELYDMVMLTDQTGMLQGRRVDRRARRQRRHAARDAAPAPARVPADHRQPDRHADHRRRAAAPTCCARSPTASAWTARTSSRPTKRSRR